MLGARVSGSEVLVLLLQGFVDIIANSASYIAGALAIDLQSHLRASTNIFSVLDARNLLKEFMERVLSLPIVDVKLYSSCVVVVVDADARKAVNAWERIAEDMARLGLRVYTDWRGETNIALEELGEKIERILYRMGLPLKPEELAKVHIPGREGATPISLFYDALQPMRTECILALLARYLPRDSAGVEVARHIAEEGFADLRQLASLLLWLANAVGYRVIDIGLVEDIETGEELFIAIHIDGCGWEEWKNMAKSIKKVLVEEGFEDLAKKVAIICDRALQTQRS